MYFVLRCGACKSRALASASGIIMKCSDAGASGMALRKFWYTSSVKKGVSGAMSLQSTRRTSKRVARDEARSCAQTCISVSLGVSMSMKTSILMT